MSNFAERLVARSAGTPPGPGISVLASRPVSRFEPVAGIEVEATVSPDLALPQGDRPIAQRETERTLPQTAAAQSSATRNFDLNPAIQATRRGPKATSTDRAAHAGAECN